MVVIVRPRAVRVATCAAAGLPSGARNWLFQRSRFASTVPPWPAPKKYTPHSARDFVAGRGIDRVGRGTHRLSGLGLPAGRRRPAQSAC